MQAVIVVASMLRLARRLTSGDLTVWRTSIVDFRLFFCL